MTKRLLLPLLFVAPLMATNAFQWYPQVDPCVILGKVHGFETMCANVAPQYGVLIIGSTSDPVKSVTYTVRYSLNSDPAKILEAAVTAQVSAFSGCSTDYNLYPCNVAAVVYFAPSREFKVLEVLMAGVTLRAVMPDEGVRYEQ